MIWAWLPLVGPIRWTTLFAFAACITVGWYRLGFLRGVLAAMAGVSTFELVFSTTGTAIHHWPLPPLLWQSAALGAWPVLAWREKIRPSAEFLIVFGTLWIVWIAEGFTFNLPTQDLRHLGVLAEVLNTSSKTAMIMAWSLPALGIVRNRRSGIGTIPPGARQPMFDVRAGRRP